MTDHQALAEFRYQIRRFLRFSEQAARLSEIEPRHHQLLLAVKGVSAADCPTIGYLAERLQIKHHSAVELIDRMVTHGLIQRVHDERDRRLVQIHLTRHGEGILKKLSAEHIRELRETGPALVAALEALVETSAEAAH